MDKQDCNKDNGKVFFGMICDTFFINPMLRLALLQTDAMCADKDNLSSKTTPRKFMLEVYGRTLPLIRKTSLLQK